MRNSHMDMKPRKRRRRRWWWWRKKKKKEVHEKTAPTTKNTTKKTHADFYRCCSDCWVEESGTKTKRNDAVAWNEDHVGCRSHDTRFDDDSHHRCYHFDYHHCYCDEKTKSHEDRANTSLGTSRDANLDDENHGDARDDDRNCCGCDDNQTLAGGLRAVAEPRRRFGARTMRTCCCWPS
jgi:hypothetical protein